MSKVVVIGGGIAGLSIGLILQSKGYDVTIIEKLDKVGGLARGIDKDSHTFESDPVVIPLSELVSEVYNRSGLDFDM